MPTIELETILWLYVCKRDKTERPGLWQLRAESGSNPN